MIKRIVTYVNQTKSKSNLVDPNATLLTEIAFFSAVHRLSLVLLCDQLHGKTQWSEGAHGTSKTSFFVAIAKAIPIQQHQQQQKCHRRQRLDVTSL